MRELLFVFLFFLIFIPSMGFAYNDFSDEENLQIDEQIIKYSVASSKEKKKQSKFFANLAQNSYLIRKAFYPSLEAIDFGEKLTKKDERIITTRIDAIKKTPKDRQIDLLNGLEKTQNISREISRALNIESSKSFEGYALTTAPTPLFVMDLNNPDINSVMGGEGSEGLHFDQVNLVRELVVVLPKDTVLTLIRKIKKGKFVYYQVRTREFDTSSKTRGYFVDERFIKKQKSKPQERKINLPSFAQVLKNLKNALGVMYIRGGAWYQGIPDMEKYYPTSLSFSEKHQKYRILNGVDCSGLLYQATDGYTPRNSRQLTVFGESVPIKGDSIQDIVDKVKPLDLIAWAGHVIIVFDKTHTIESRWRANFSGGVEMTDITKRLEEIMTTRTPVDEYSDADYRDDQKFVIRRRYPNK